MDDVLDWSSYIGSTVELLILDHSDENEKNEFIDTEVEVTGKITRVTKKFIILTHWKLRTDDPAESKINNEIMRIMKSAVIEMIPFQALEKIHFRH